MVTTQEINQAENQLSQVESQARQQAQSKIPRRRFGTRVTSQQQQNILKQRQEAEQTLRQVGEQRQKLQSLRQDISSQEATDNKLSYISKLANSSIPINLLKAQRKDYGLSKNDVANIQEIREGQLNIQKIKDQQAQFNREGIKPITNSQGQIVGFLDENRQQSIPIENITKIASSSSEDYNRYVRAGIIKAEPTIREQIQLQSLTPEERSQVVLSKEVMSYREPSKSIEVKARERLKGLREYGGVSAFGSGLATPVTETAFFVKRAVTQSPLRTGQEVKEGVVSLYSDIRTGELKREILDTFKNEPAFFFGRLTGEIFTFKISQEIFVKTPSTASSIATRFSPNYLRVSEELVNIGDTTFIKKVIKDIPDIKIEFIPPKSPDIKDISRLDLPPSIKGAFGYSAKEQSQYLGNIGLATSQRGLKKVFNNIIEIKEIEKGYGLFATPAESSKVFSTRISRLGELPRSPTIKELLTLNFSLFKRTPRSEIFIFPREIVGGKGGFEILTRRGVSGKRTGELEAITPSPNIEGAPKYFEVIKKIGVTTLGKGFGKRTTIYEAKLSNTKVIENILEDLGKLNKKGIESTKELQDIYISKTALLLESPKVTIKVTQDIQSFNQNYPNIVRLNALSLNRISNYEYKMQNYSTPIPSPIMFSLIRFNDITRPPSPPPIRPDVPRPPSPPKSPRQPPKLKPSNIKFDTSKDLTKGFKTYFFVGGKKIYLSGLSPREQAILKGQRATLKSLSARFGIEETNKLIRDSNVTATKDYNKFFREYKIMQNKTIKTPNIFIQKRGKRLVSKAERQLIQSARKNKRR